MSKKKSKRRVRRRYDPVRLGIVIFALVLVIAMVIGVFSGVIRLAGSHLNSDSSLASGSSSSQSAVSDSAAASSQTDVQDLAVLKNDLKNEIQSLELADLEEQINAYLDEHQVDRSKISWAIQDLTTDATIESDNAKEDFTAASTYKLPLCTYYYEQIAQGKISPDDTLEYTAAMQEKEDAENLNQPIHRKYQVGDKIQIDELLEAALLYSDNIAGHMLYENLGGYTRFKQIVTQYSDQPQSADFYSEDVNVLNADYMMKLIHHLYNTEGTFNDLKYWLQNATIDTFLNRDLSGAYIQKVGNINEVRNAAGFYNGPAPFSLTVYSCISKEEGQNILADLGVLCYSYFQNKYASGFYDGTDQERISTLNAQMSYPTDVINLRPGLNGQTIRPLTEEEQKQADEALLND